MNPREQLESIAEDHDDLLHGRCVSFAVAMHRLTGLPLYGLVGYDEEFSEEVLIHAYVRLNSELLVDIRGPRTFHDMFEDFENDEAALDADEASFTIAELAKLGTGSHRCPSLRTVMPIAKKVWQLTRELLQ